MKIGFSLGRCIRDIVNGDVNYNDVAYIIAATAIRDEEQLKHVIDDYLYRRDYLEGLDEAACQKIAADLYNTGKVLQPRLQGVHKHQVPQDALWADMFPTNYTENESAKRAWDNYRLMIHMTASVPENVEAHWK